MVARRLAAWFETREANGDLRYPWLSPPDGDSPGQRAEARWLVIQAEILFGRARAESARTLWPVLKKLDTPGATLANGDQLRDMASWIDRAPYAERVLETAVWLDENSELFGTVDGMRSAPNVTEAIAELAARVAPSPDEDPVLATKGVLRVAARHSGTSVNRRNSRSDGRIALARLIGAEDATSDHAFLALIELAETVCLSKPACPSCPLRRTCATALSR